MQLLATKNAAKTLCVNIQQTRSNHPKFEEAAGEEDLFHQRHGLYLVALPAS
jgi:hypothetical protein